MTDQYIITEEQINKWCGCISVSDAEKILTEVLDHPYNPQAERSIPIQKIYELMDSIALVGDLCNIYGDPKKPDLINGCFIEPWRLGILMRKYLEEPEGKQEEKV